MKPPVELSVVIPIFNEEEILWDNMEHLAGKFDEIIGPGRWQYILVDNGSVDDTRNIVERIIQR